MSSGAAHEPPAPADNGIYAAPPDSTTLRDAVRRAGGAWRIVDLAGARDKDALLRRIAGALGFPAYFGGNWDALADSLQDLSWLPAGTLIVELRNVGASARGDWTMLLDILRDAAIYWRTRGRAFVVLVRDARDLPAFGA